jgi:hypothetical protein
MFARTEHVSWFSLPYYWLPKLGTDIVGWIVGLFITYLTGHIVFLSIPTLTPAKYAWPTYISFHILFIYFFLYSISIAHQYAPYMNPFQQEGVRSHMSISDAKEGKFVRNYLSIWELRWIFFWQMFSFSLMRLFIFPEFVVKMFVLFPMIGFSVLASVNVFRHVFKLMEKQILKEQNQIQNLPLPVGNIVTRDQ